VGQRADFGADWSEVVQTWFLGQPTVIDAKQGWSALGALERLTPERLDELKRLPTEFPLMMSRAIRLGQDLADCEPCEGFERVLARVRKGERSAVSEIMWGALLIRSGCAIEFEPHVGPRRADTLIIIGDDTVYAEVMAPRLSVETTDKMAAMKDISEQLRDALHGVRVELHLTDDPRVVDGDALLSSLADCVFGTQAGASEMTVAPVRWELYRSCASWRGPISPSKDSPRFGTASFSIGGPDSCIVAVSADISDARIERMIQKKRRQMCRDNANLLVVDMTAVGGSKGEWDSLVPRRFQPGVNTRVGALVMLHEECEQHDLRFRTSVTRNPYARRAIPASLIEAISGE